MANNSQYKNRQTHPSKDGLAIKNNQLLKPPLIDDPKFGQEDLHSKRKAVYEFLEKWMDSSNASAIIEPLPIKTVEMVQTVLEDLEKIVSLFKNKYKHCWGTDPPEDPAYYIKYLFSNVIEKCKNPDKLKLTYLCFRAFFGGYF